MKSYKNIAKALKNHPNIRSNNMHETRTKQFSYYCAITGWYKTWDNKEEYFNVSFLQGAFPKSHVDIAMHVTSCPDAIIAILKTIEPNLNINLR